VVSSPILKWKHFYKADEVPGLLVWDFCCYTSVLFLLYRSFLGLEGISYRKLRNGVASWS